MFTSQDVFPDTATERKILSMAIRCPSEGCEWIGELKNREVKTNTRLDQCLRTLLSFNPFSFNTQGKAVAL